MGDVFGIGAGLQAFSDLAAAGMNYDAQLDYNQKYLQGVNATNETNIGLAREQNVWNLEQWKRENTYNSPQEQVKRLQAAGLSSAAAAQAATGGQAAPLQSANLAVAQPAQPLQAPKLDLSGVNIIGLARAVEDLRQSKLETKLKQNEVTISPEKIRTEQQFREWQLKSLQQEYQHSAELWPYSKRAAMFDMRLKQGMIKEQHLVRKEMRLKLNTARKELSWMDKFKEAEWTKIWTDIANNLKTGDLIEENTKNAKKQGALYSQTYARNEIVKAFDKYGGVPENAALHLAILVAEGVIKPQDVDKNIDNFKQIFKYLREGISVNLTDEQIDLLDMLEGQFQPAADEVTGIINGVGKAVTKGLKKAAQSAPNMPRG